MYILKKLFVAIIFVFVFVFISLSYNDFLKEPPRTDTNNDRQKSEQSKNCEKISMDTDSGIHQYIEEQAQTIIQNFGEPSRKEPSAYGYEWWIYNQSESQYAQFGISDGKVVTIYVIGDTLNMEPFEIGSSSAEIFSRIELDSTVSVEYDGGSYRFELSEEEMVTRPLVKVGDVWAQLYFDKFTQRLSSVRYITPKYLLIQRPYELVYRGELINPPETTEEQWRAIEEGEERQIIDITNILRNRHDVQPVEYHEKAAEVAFGHSKEMYEENYFSHSSPVNGDLSDRLATAGLLYSQAGENIAANYIDAPATVVGWLNSEGHRKTMLNEEYTHLGVGVYHRYYTQNFIVPWNNE